jgi:prepilin-type N-terminal cleavage/methylation domain-containing protein
MRIRDAKGRKRRELPRQAGLTLIELLIGIAISALIMIAFLALYSEGQKYFINQSARADTMEDSRYPMSWISRDIRGAAQISDLTIDVDGGSYATSPNCLVMEVPAIDGSGANISGVSDYIIYAVSGGRLMRVVAADETSSRTDRSRIMSDAVNGFGLVYLQSDGLSPTSNYPDTFIVDVTLSASRPGLFRSGQPFVEIVNTRAKLRNKAEPEIP